MRVQSSIRTNSTCLNSLAISIAERWGLFGMGNQKPNVVVVMTTQWRAQATGYGGDGNAVTPFLDSLAEQSIDFYQAVTPHPFGVFARSAFLTGIACPENGICDYYDSLPVNAKTLAHLYKENGYESAFFGKWQLFERNQIHPVVGVEHALVEVPDDRRGGFAFWEGFESGFLLNDGYYHGTRLGPPTQIKGYQSDVVADRVRRFLESRENKKPLFTLISLDAPHPPYQEDAAGILPPPTDSLVLPKEVPEDPDIQSVVKKELSGYYAHIEATDRAIQNLVGHLRYHLDWENTIFVFTSAHGDMHGSHGLFRKGWPHEESIRVPLLISWPNFFTEPRRDPLLISLLDLGPSLFGLCFKKEIQVKKTPFQGTDLSTAMRLAAEGPDCQWISMPSAPPFEKQCPVAWRAKRDIRKTEVTNAQGERFTLDH